MPSSTIQLCYHITGNKAEEKFNLGVNDLNSYILANAVI